MELSRIPAKVLITSISLHELWRIEESFRIQKHDLKVRPVFHWNESRIRAHLAICFMAFCCVRHLEYRVTAAVPATLAKVIRW